MNFLKKHVKAFSYLGVVFVVVVWGVIPPLTTYLYNFYSAAIYTAGTTFFAGIALLLMSLKKLNLLNKELLKVAIPTGLIIAAASLSQKIGLQYTTPTRYAFLENLCCVVVPIVLFITVRKKPTLLTIISVVICLIGSFILCGGNMAGGFGIGEILCSLAGCLYGVNIAITGNHAKKVYAPLFVMVQTWIQCGVSLLSALVLNFVKINGVALEQFQFTFDVGLIALLAVIGLISNTLCWTVRTNAMKHVGAGAVAIIMPFSAVVTGVLSVLIGTDKITSNLVIGALLGFLAAMLSGLDDVLESKKQEKLSVIKFMKLQEIPFQKIKDGTKTIELRLYDEKRQQITVGDVIEFTKSDDTDEKIRCEVLELFVFDNFEQLYEQLPLTECGYTKEELSSASHTDMEKYYSREEQQKYGVVGIKIKKQ